MMHHQHTADDIRPGDVVTYQPDPAPGFPERATIYVLAVNPDNGLNLVRAVSFTYSSWPHLYMDRLNPTHPVTITRPAWATIGDRMMSHLINPHAGDAVTWCEAEGAEHLEAAHMPGRPLCRTCGYRAGKEFAALAQPFTYHLPTRAPHEDQDPGEDSTTE